MKSQFEEKMKSQLEEMKSQFEEKMKSQLEEMKSQLQKIDRLPPELRYLQKFLNPKLFFHCTLLILILLRDLLEVESLEKFNLLDPKLTDMFD